jgi:hypothetical protein
MLSKWEIRYLIILTCVMVAIVMLVITNFYIRTQLNDMYHMLQTIHSEHHQLYPNPPNDIK